MLRITQDTRLNPSWEKPTIMYMHSILTVLLEWLLEYIKPHCLVKLWILPEPLLTLRVWLCLRAEIKGKPVAIETCRTSCQQLSPASSGCNILVGKGETNCWKSKSISTQVCLYCFLFFSFCFSGSTAGLSMTGGTVGSRSEEVGHDIGAIEIYYCIFLLQKLRQSRPLGQSNKKLFSSGHTTLSCTSCN